MRLAVIPARGGSKRIPRKNIREFCGKPMIVRSIEAAKNSECFDRIIVSTDDEEIAEISKAFGAEVPFTRPPDLSDDNTPTLPVVVHAIEWTKVNLQPPREVCCIYATAPFLQAEVLRRGYETLLEKSCDYVFPVTSFAFPIQRAIKISQTGRLEMFSPKHFESRSQDLEEAYHDAGQFYWGMAETWLSGKEFYSPNSAPLILPRSRVQDIDTTEDWEQAEMMYKYLQEHEQSV